jgi:hypothetical protein
LRACSRAFFPIVGFSKCAFAAMNDSLSARLGNCGGRDRKNAEQNTRAGNDAAIEYNFHHDMILKYSKRKFLNSMEPPESCARSRRLLPGGKNAASLSILILEERS